MSVQRAGVLEEEELAERYVITHYPGLPYKPAFPNRPLFLVVSVFLGFTISLFAGILLEALDGTIRGTRDIKAILAMPPIAAIPQIYTVDDMKNMRASKIAYFASIGIVLVAVTIYVHLQSIGAI
jgi:hypothetical protein